MFAQSVALSDDNIEDHTDCQHENIFLGDNMKTDHLLFGAAYYSEYLPYDRVEKDMEMMEKAGMNTIRIAESTWSTIEPKDGIFDFTHLDKMLEAAARHHISVIVGTPTYAILAWLAKKYPDILALTNNGQNIYGARQNMDITHAGYLFHCERVIRAMMEHIKDVPHIIGFQLDNETKSYGTAGLRVQAMFVDYLKEKYPDINEFNREFGLDYWSNRVNTWEDFPDVRGTINESLAAEFAKFQRLLVTRFLTWQAAIVSGYKRPDQFITQNFDYDWTDHSIGYQPEVNQYEAARCMTVAGCDIYHPSQSLLTGEEITFCGNISRSLKKDNCNGVQREHNKKLNNGLPILHKVPPKRDYGRYFCIMAKKGGTSHGGLTEKLSPFFHAQKQEVNAYGR